MHPVHKNIFEELLALVFVIKFRQSDKLILSARIMNTSYIPSFTFSRLPNMLIAPINKTVVLDNPPDDILKGILTLITGGRFYLDKDMCTTLIGYDYPRCPGVDLTRPHYLVSQSNHTHSL